MADQGQRTEQPTDRRIEKARKEGNFAASKEFVSSLQFAAFVALLSSFSTEFLLETRELTRFLLARGFESEVTSHEVHRLLRDLLVPASIPLFLGGALLVLITVAVQVASTKLGLSLKKLQPDISRLNPVKKLKGIPRQNVPQFLQAAVLMPLFLYAVYLIVSENTAAFLQLPLMGVESGLRLLGVSIEELFWKAAALFLVLGVIDLIRQRRRYVKDLRMTKQEVRDEFKEVEGNPHTKARIRRLQRDLVRRQMMADVAGATAVVVNPTHFAVAIRYDADSMAVPTVVAKGRDYLAQRIREKAAEHQVPIVENPPLARSLYKSVEIGHEIPAHLYRAVAEILAFVIKQRQKMATAWKGTGTA